MRRLGTLFLVICLVLMVVGCSGGAKPDPDPGQKPGEPGKDPGEKPAEEPAPLEAFYDIEEVQDIVKYFKELEYSFSDPGSKLTVNYLYMGQEQVAGSSTDHVSISFAEGKDKTEMEIWMDKSGTVLKAKFEGQVLDAMQAPMATMFLSVILVPFVMHASGWQDAFVETKGFEKLGWVESSRTRENRNFGAGNTTVHRYSFKVKGMGGGPDLDYRFEVAEIGGKSMFVGWEVEISKEQTSSFRVDKVVLR